MICVLLSVGFPQHDSAREDEGGVAVVVGAAVGWRSSEDFNAALPKSRLAQEQVLTWL